MNDFKKILSYQDELKLVLERVSNLESVLRNHKAYLVKLGSCIKEFKKYIDEQFENIYSWLKELENEVY